VREVENTVKRVIVLCEKEEAGFDDLPEHIQQFCISAQPPEHDTLEEGLSLSDAVRDYERRLILEALERSHGIKAKAAQLLNIKRTTLVEKMKKQHLEKKAIA
jgi:DNA-binding NtrC family response regulator